MSNRGMETKSTRKRDTPTWYGLLWNAKGYSIVSGAHCVCLWFAIVLAARIFII